MSSLTQVLWGTNINATDVQMKLKNFINNFVEMKDDADDDEDDKYTAAPLYIEKMKEMREAEEVILDVDCDHIFSFDQGLYRQIEDYPTDIIPIFDLVVSQVFKELFMYGIGSGTGAGGFGGANQNSVGATAEMQGEDDAQGDMIIQVRPFNLRKVYRIRELDPTHIDKLVTLKGIVIRNSDIVPEMKEAFFICFHCQREEQRFLERGKIQEPTYCENCNKRNTFAIVHNQCLFSDK